MIPDIDTVIIENVRPRVGDGSSPIKRVMGDWLEVEADIFTHGHDVLRAMLQVRRLGQAEWQEMEMTAGDNDRWHGRVLLEHNGEMEYTILAWRDPFLSWSADLRKKHAAGMEITSELEEGRQLVQAVLERATPADRSRLEQLMPAFDVSQPAAVGRGRALELLQQLQSQADASEPVDATLLDQLRRAVEQLATATTPPEGADPVTDVVLGEQLAALMGLYADRSDGGTLARPLRVIVDRRAARFAAWYEMFARSQGTLPDRSATFDDMIHRLDEVARMGFDVVYLPPIHPIGETNRKGPNNSLICPPGSPGCPYAIGNAEGGHDAVHPELGTLDDFDRFVEACRERGMEVALDFAVQASPDHPWVREHPQWFRHRPDGSIKYAENPPKKYEDIYPIDFNTSDPDGLWNELLRVLRFWMGRGVRTFRVDNPHTKPVQFWQWLIDEIRATDPDVVFLSEAFTRPKMMKALAKAGFSQSYTYFTWRNFKHELTEYFTELSQSEVAEYMRGNLFCNTPDILPEVLQNAPRSAFKMRATLAATLSPLWGIYNGFELCEGTPIPGREEYLDSEKYQYKVWDWDRPGNIKDTIGRLNRIRKAHPAMEELDNLRFHRADNENVLFYSRISRDGRDAVLVVVNLDPYRAQEATVHVPLELLELRPDETYQVHELLTDRRFYWKGSQNYVRLDPEDQPAHVFHLLRWSHREQDFDYFI